MDRLESNGKVHRCTLYGIACVDREHAYYLAWVNWMVYGWTHIICTTNHKHRPNLNSVHIQSAHNCSLFECYVQEFIIRRIETHVS